MKVRWYKVLNDLLGNKKRSLLVVLSIAVGVLSVGLATGAQTILGRELPAGYLATDPAGAKVITTSFDDDLVKAVRHVPGVRDAEGRRSMVARFQTGPDEWRSVKLFAIPHFDDMRVNKVHTVQGAWPPRDHEILIEQAALSIARARVGDEVVIRLANGKQRILRVVGVAHDQSQEPATFDGDIYGYVTLGTLEWLGEPRDYNELYITVDRGMHDLAQIRRIAARVRRVIEDSGRIVLATSVPEPGKLALQDAVDGIMVLLSTFGVFILILSGFLVVNTLSALLGQQVRQVGIMKAIGARTTQIASLYLGMALAFGVMAVIVGAPLGLLGARWLAVFVASIINSDVTDLSVPPFVLALEVAIGLLAPLLAALFPVLSGTRITVREALNDNSAGRGQFGTGWLDRRLRDIRGLPSSWLLPLRNVFRRKGRLALTLTTLSLASAFFIAVISTYASALLSIDRGFQYWGMDLMLTLNRPHRIARLEREALKVPDVVHVEPSNFVQANRVYADDSEGDVLLMFALLAHTSSIKPDMLEGRWLLPEDENEIVITNKFLDKEPGVKVGDSIRLKVLGKEINWRVVGIAYLMMSEGPTVYVNLPYLSSVAGLRERADGLYIHTARHDAASQLQALQDLDRHFKSQGIRITSTMLIADLRTTIRALFDAVVTVLMVMAGLLSIVGGLGLMGIMSLNVLERSREIGVLRAIGASDNSLLKIILIEGILIGLASWLVGCVIAYPLSKALSDAVGMAMIQTPFTFTFSAAGVLLWLALVVVLTSAACYIPARNACQITIRETLAYE
jgi:putative ABC transport system permease protein